MTPMPVRSFAYEGAKVIWKNCSVRWGRFVAESEMPRGRQANLACASGRDDCYDFSGEVGLFRWKGFIAGARAGRKGPNRLEHFRLGRCFYCIFLAKIVDFYYVVCRLANCRIARRICCVDSQHCGRTSLDTGSRRRVAPVPDSSLL